MIKEKNYDAVFHAQSHFRSVLDSMARPGKLNPLEAIDIRPVEGMRVATASVVFALVNRDVTFQVVGFGPEAIEYIKANRHTDVADASEAAFLVCDGFPSENIVENANEGILTYPETSASLIIQTSVVYSEPVDGTLGVVLSGPGVPDSKTVFFKDAPKAFFEALSIKNSEFPLGIDVIILTDSPDFPKQECALCIPRTSKITFVD
jgi:alpha-D-ribose 1-methylphosphonate 5-triphosphate synthase subunit PhnH